MEKVRLEIIGMSYSQSQSGAYALILGVVGARTRIPIMIGAFEAQSIAIGIEKMKPTRPLTHDLFKNFAEHFNIDIEEVIINKFEEGIFYAKLICNHNGQISEIDSRTSDAIALAIRFECPIYCNKEIIREVGIEMDEKEDSKSSEPQQQTEEMPTEESPQQTYGSKYKNYPIEELEELLKKAVEEENYEEASVIRDEIKRRKNAL